MSPDLGQVAAAVARGLAVFPLPPGGRVPEPGWQRQATVDVDALPELLADGRNVGVGCRASRVVVLDLDVHHAAGPARSGLQALRAQLEARGISGWPETFTTATPSGGLHLYFSVGADCTIGSFSGARSPLGPGIDVRGPGRRSGGYVVGPGSTVHGLPYRIASDRPLAALPDWIAERLTTPTTPGRTSR